MTPDKLRQAQDAMREAKTQPQAPESQATPILEIKPKKTRPIHLSPAKPLAKKNKRTIGTGNHPNTLKNLKHFQWPKGKSGNPGGLPGYDVAAEVARRAFEMYRNDAIIGLGKQLKHGNAYVFKEMADRGYGKLKEKLELSGADEIATQLEAARKRSKGK